mmetsp:Transcript_53187/g.127183  ORF Transcript_53187/g.127183 Transcript_53187/m.127183 type:complete len:210 (-) Transcript_53187:1683-2312(-)
MHRLCLGCHGARGELCLGALPAARARPAGGKESEEHLLGRRSQGGLRGESAGAHGKGSEAKRTGPEASRVRAGAKAEALSFTEEKDGEDGEDGHRKRGDFGHRALAAEAEAGTKSKTSASAHVFSGSGLCQSSRGRGLEEEQACRTRVFHQRGSRSGSARARAFGSTAEDGGASTPPGGAKRGVCLPARAEPPRRRLGSLRGRRREGAQ